MHRANYLSSLVVAIARAGPDMRSDDDPTEPKPPLKPTREPPYMFQRTAEMPRCRCQNRLNRALPQGTAPRSLINRALSVIEAW